MAEKEKKKGVITEFKEFISRGSVVDMAVGIIIGTAFTAIVSSLVADIFMPLLGLLTNGISFSDLKVVLSKAEIDPATLEIIKPEASINYGLFIEKIINFLLVAVAVFSMIKVISTVKAKADALKKKEEEEAVAQEETVVDLQVELLTEIRDLLKEGNS